MREAERKEGNESGGDEEGAGETGDRCSGVLGVATRLAARATRKREISEIVREKGVTFGHHLAFSIFYAPLSLASRTRDSARLIYYYFFIIMLHY